MSRTTIKDIAAHLGLSKTAVSFAFNNPSKLPEATVARILNAARELGYVPDPLARSMATGKTKTIGLLLPQPLKVLIRNPFVAELLAGIGEEAETEEQALLLLPPVDGSITEAVERAAVDGVVLLGVERSTGVVEVLQRRKMHYVIIDSVEASMGLSVNVEDEAGAEALMLEILRLGHRKIAFFVLDSSQKSNWREYCGVIGRRAQGYQKALEQYGMSLDHPEITIVPTPVALGAGKRAFESVFQSGKPAPTALVAMSDVLAIELLDSAQNRGLAVPSQVSIVGFDDIPASAYARPSLTTVSQPIVEKGRLAVRMLNALIADQPTNSVVLPTRLVIRESLGPAPRSN